MPTTCYEKPENVIDPRRSALILIDFQRDVIGSPDGPLARFIAAHNVLGNAAKVAGAARAAGMMVIHVKVERRPDLTDIVDYVTDWVLEGKMRPNRSVPRLIEGTPGADFLDELRPQPGDIVVVKRRVSAFYGTPLEIYLQTRGIDTLLFGGVLTNMGVESTVRDAYDRNYQCIVLKDCCASVPDEAHEYPIKNVFPRIARVMTSDQAIAMFTGTRAAPGNITSEENRHG